MAPINSALASPLRSKIISHNARKFGDASRAIVGTTRNVRAAGLTAKSPISPHFIPQGTHHFDKPSKPQESQFIPPFSDFRTNGPPSPVTHINPPPTHNGESSYDHLLNSIITSLTSTPSPQIPHLHSLLRGYSSNPSHWSKYAHANPLKQYTRNLVCEVPGLFNLLLLVWTPGKASPVHDHANAHCLMKVLQGEIRETRFAIPRRPGEEGPLVETSSLGFRTGKVSYMADVLGLHSVSNPHPTDYAVTLHLYTPPYAAMRGCHIYDGQNGQAKHVMPCAYDSVKGVVPESER